MIVNFFHEDNREDNCDHDEEKLVTLERDVVCLKHEQAQLGGLPKLIRVIWIETGQSGGDFHGPDSEVF